MEVKNEKLYLIAIIFIALFVVIGCSKKQSSNLLNNTPSNLGYTFNQFKQDYTNTLVALNVPFNFTSENTYEQLNNTILVRFTDSSDAYFQLREGTGEIETINCHVTTSLSKDIDLDNTYILSIIHSLEKFNNTDDTINLFVDILALPSAECIESQSGYQYSHGNPDSISWGIDIYINKEFERPIDVLKKVLSEKGNIREDMPKRPTYDLFIQSYTLNAQAIGAKDDIEWSLYKGTGNSIKIVSNPTKSLFLFAEKDTPNEMIGITLIEVESKPNAEKDLILQALVKTFEPERPTETIPDFISEIHSHEMGKEIYSGDIVYSWYSIFGFRYTLIEYDRSPFPTN